MSRICTWSCVLTVLLLLAGCRTYGGDGTEEAVYGQIERIVERFGEDLSRARGDVGALQAAASNNAHVAALSARYAQLVEAHEAVLEEHEQMAADLSPASDYRTLRRVYGAMIAEQQLLRRQYQGVLGTVYDAYSADTTGVSVEARRPYALIPPYYVRTANGGRELTVNAVLAHIRSGAVPREGFVLTMPEVPQAHGPEGDGASEGH